jgi:hypothetical protein
MRMLRMPGNVLGRFMSHRQVLTDGELDERFGHGIDESGDDLVVLSRVRVAYLDLLSLLADTFEDQIAGNVEDLIAFFADDFRDALHRVVWEYVPNKEEQRRLLSQFAGGPWYTYDPDVTYFDGEVIKKEED